MCWHRNILIRQLLRKSKLLLIFCQSLPDTDVITAGMDTLCPEGERYANLLKEAGVKTTYRCFANSRHGFAVNLYDEWKEGETYIVELMKKHFAVEK